MKRQFQILTIFITVAFASCSKETVNNPEGVTTEEISVSKAAKVIDPLSVNLEGWFTFDNNLKDKTGKLGDASPTNSNLLIYTSDRKGKGKSAINFDGTYGIRIYKVPIQTHISISLWLKPSNAHPSSTHVADGIGLGTKIFQGNGNLGGGITNYTGSQSSWISGLSSAQWYHVVVTYDGNYLKLYMNKVLKVNIHYSGTIGSILQNYLIGMDTNGGRWQGYLDDVRFYSRTLSSTDVQNLYNL